MYLWNDGWFYCRPRNVMYWETEKETLLSNSVVILAHVNPFNWKSLAGRYFVSRTISLNSVGIRHRLWLGVVSVYRVMEGHVSNTWENRATQIAQVPWRMGPRLLLPTLSLSGVRGYWASQHSDDTTTAVIYRTAACSFPSNRREIRLAVARRANL